MLPSTEDIVCITQNVLDTMLNMNATLAEATDSVEQTPPITGCVQISGEWKGAVVIHASDTFVRHAATRMLKMKLEDVVEADLQDVLAEITNMVGGNIKSHVPGPSFLSIPSVTIGQNFRFHLRGARVVSETPMTSGDESLSVLICESTDAA